MMRGRRTDRSGFRPSAGHFPLQSWQHGIRRPSYGRRGGFQSRPAQDALFAGVPAKVSGLVGAPPSLFYTSCPLSRTRALEASKNRGRCPKPPRDFALCASSMRTKGKTRTRQPCDGRRPHGAPGPLWNDRSCGTPPRLPCCWPNASNAGGLGAAPPNQSKYGTSEWKMSPSPEPCRLPHHSVKNLSYSERLTGHQSGTTTTIRPDVRSTAFRRRIPSGLPLSKKRPASDFPPTLDSTLGPVLPPSN
jgi:hypothetical protein